MISVIFSCMFISSIVIPSLLPPLPKQVAARLHELLMAIFLRIGGMTRVLIRNQTVNTNLGGKSQDLTRFWVFLKRLFSNGCFFTSMSQHDVVCRMSQHDQMFSPLMKHEMFIEISIETPQDDRNHGEYSYRFGQNPQPRRRS